MQNLFAVVFRCCAGPNQYHKSPWLIDLFYLAIYHIFRILSRNQRLHKKKHSNYHKLYSYQWEVQPGWSTLSAVGSWWRVVHLQNSWYLAPDTWELHGPPETPCLLPHSTVPIVVCATNSEVHRQVQVIARMCTGVTNTEAHMHTSSDIVILD